MKTNGDEALFSGQTYLQDLIRKILLLNQHNPALKAVRPKAVGYA